MESVRSALADGDIDLADALYKQYTSSGSGLQDFSGQTDRGSFIKEFWTQRNSTIKTLDAKAKAEQKEKDAKNSALKYDDFKNRVDEANDEETLATVTLDNRQALENNEIKPSEFKQVSNAVSKKDTSVDKTLQTPYVIDREITVKANDGSDVVIGHNMNVVYWNSPDNSKVYMKVEGLNGVYLANRSDVIPNVTKLTPGMTKKTEDKQKKKVTAAKPTYRAIPSDELRGKGVPDELVTQVEDLKGQYDRATGAARVDIRKDYKDAVKLVNDYLKRKGSTEHLDDTDLGTDPMDSAGAQSITLSDNEVDELAKGFVYNILVAKTLSIQDVRKKIKEIPGLSEEDFNRIASATISHYGRVKGR